MLESSTNPIHVRQRDLYTQIGVMSEVNSKNKSSSYTDRRLREQSDFYIWKKDSIHGQHILVSQKFINLNFFCILHEIVCYSARSQKITYILLLFFFSKFQFSFNRHHHKVQSEGIDCIFIVDSIQVCSSFFTMTRKSGMEKKWKSFKTMVSFLKAEQIQSMLGIVTYSNRCDVRNKSKK